MRNRSQGNVGVGGRGGKSKAAVVHRRRVLHATLQQSAGREIQKYDGGATGGIPIGQDFLVALLRHLVRLVSGDVVLLAAHAAAGETGLSKEDCRRVIASLQREQDEYSVWPEGFMP